MKLSSKLLITLPILFLLFFITPTKVHALTSSTNPGTITGQTVSITITISGTSTELDPSKTYKIAGLNGGSNSTLFEGKATNGSITTVASCPKGDKVGWFTFKTNCDPGDYFNQGEIYKADFYDANKPGTGNVTLEFTVGYYQPLLFTDPPKPVPTQDTYVYLLARPSDPTGLIRPETNTLMNTYYLEPKNIDTGNVMNHFCLVMTDLRTDKANLGQLPVGNYTIGVYKAKSNCSMDGNKHVMDMAFSVATDGGVVTKGGAKLEVPNPGTPLTSKFATLPQIVISGLTDGWSYHIKLFGGWGGDLSLNGSKEFPAPGGKITVENICENGEAGRTGANECKDNFQNGTYGIGVYELNGKSVLQDAFSVIVQINLVGGPIGIAPVDSCTGSGSNTECKTGLGILSGDPAKFVNQVVGIAIGIAAGIAFLLFAYGGFRLAFSQGDPKAVQEGREIITSAIIGFLIIIFSVFLLRLIGIDILGLPI